MNSVYQFMEHVQQELAIIFCHQHHSYKNLKIINTLLLLFIVSNPKRKWHKIQELMLAWDGLGFSKRKMEKHFPNKFWHNEISLCALPEARNSESESLNLNIFRCVVYAS